MKNLFNYFALCLTVVFGLAVSSCGGNCSGVECGTHGACDEADGACACETGYEVDTDGKCEVVSRAKFMNTAGWNVTDICPSGTYNYVAEILESSSAINEVIIRNYGGYGAGSAQLEVKATIEGTKLTVAAQTVTFNAETYNIEAANGTLTGGNTFTLTYRMSGGAAGTGETCSATFVKK